MHGCPSHSFGSSYSASLVLPFSFPTVMTRMSCSMPELAAPGIRIKMLTFSTANYCFIVSLVFKPFAQCWVVTAKLGNKRILFAHIHMDAITTAQCSLIHCLSFLRLTHEQLRLLLLPSKVCICVFYCPIVDNRSK